MKKNTHTKRHKKNVKIVPAKIVLKKFHRKIPPQENERLVLTKYLLRHQLLLQLWMDF
jgi:hypothetical protein